MGIKALLEERDYYFICDTAELNANPAILSEKKSSRIIESIDRGIYLVSFFRQLELSTKQLALVGLREIINLISRRTKSAFRTMRCLYWTRWYGQYVT